jgi:hypothetical protein
MKYLMILLMLTCLSSCYNSQKALDKLERKDPVKLAEYCKKELPCTGIDTVVKSDTLYEFLELICPENTDNVQKDTFYITKPDKYRGSTGQVKVIAIPAKTKTITIKVLDSASLRIAALRLADMKGTADKYIAKNESKARLLLWLIIALAVSVIGNVVLIRFK